MTISFYSAKFEPYVNLLGNCPGLNNINIIQNFLVSACSMPRYGYPHSKHTAIISLFLYENDNFLYQLLSKHASKMHHL